MLTLEFNDAEERMIKSFNELDRKLEENKEVSEATLRAHNILSNAIARMIAKKTRDLPWKSPLITARGGYTR